ncbi:hypothetical protein J437_LFUL016501, partial [Ladona fulva]
IQLVERNRKRYTAVVQAIIIPSNISKIFEIAAPERLSYHLEANRLLTNVQHSFRKKNSTVTALTDIIYSISYSIDQSDSTLGLVCDISTAFNCINHEILVHKLNHKGIAENKKTITNYVKEIYISDWNTTGISQGSVIRP